MDRVTHLAGYNKLVAGREGFFLANEHDMYIGQSMIRYGEFSHPELELFGQLLRPGCVAADIGANIGTHTVGLANLVGPTGRVLAFEPQPVIFQNLCANVALNSLSHVDAFNCGLSDAAGSIVMPYYRYDQTANFGGIALDPDAEQGLPVDIKRFDDVFPYPRLDLIKVDVEGMEEQALRGAAESIEKFKPILYVENDREEQSPSLIQFIKDCGYRLWWHTPPLFNPNNHFGESENIFGQIVSVNMLCIHSSIEVKMSGLKEV